MAVKNFPLLAAAAIVSLFTSSQALAVPCALPNTISNGQPADAAALMADLNALVNCVNGAAGSSTNSIQTKNSTGGFTGIGPLTNGQVLVGSTGGTPVPATIGAGAGIGVTNSAGGVSIAAKIVAGAGISVTNSAGTLSIAATGSGGGGGSGVYREFGPFAPPTAASFTTLDAPASITPTVTNVANVGLNYSTPITSNNEAVPGAYRTVPSLGTWTLTFRAAYASLPGAYPQFGGFLKDTSGKMLGVILEGNLLIIRRNNSNVSVNSNPYQVSVPSVPNWFRIAYDGTNITFSVSWDSQNWAIIWTETKTTFLNGTLQLVGLGGLSAISNTGMWLPGSKTGAIITYWDIDDDPASVRTQ